MKNVSTDEKGSNCPLSSHSSWFVKRSSSWENKTVYFVSLRFFFCLDIWRKWSPPSVSVCVDENWTITLTILTKSGRTDEIIAANTKFHLFPTGNWVGLLLWWLPTSIGEETGSKEGRKLHRVLRVGVKEWKRLGNIWLARNWFDCECLSWCLSEHGEMKSNGLVSILWWLEFLEMDLFRMFGLKRLRMETILSSGKPLRKQKG